RYIRFLNKRAKKRLNTKLFRIQPYPKTSLISIK
ncbi:protein mom, partial [Escherichia coli]